MATSIPARASDRAIACPTRMAPPVTSARRRTLPAPLARGVILGETMRNWLKVRFIAGFFVTVPVFLTAWLLWIFWSRIDDVFAPMYDGPGRRAPPPDS